MASYERVYLKCLKSQAVEFEELAVPTWMARLTEPRTNFAGGWSAPEPIPHGQEKAE